MHLKAVLRIKGMSALIRKQVVINFWLVVQTCMNHTRFSSNIKEKISSGCKYIIKELHYLFNHYLNNFRKNIIIGQHLLMELNEDAKKIS